MLTTPVLQLNPERVGDIDPRDVSSLFGMWTVFNRCAQSIPDGRRLENLSWRLWARETLCCPPQPHDLITPAIDISPTTSTGVPSLAGSIDTEPDEDSALSKSRGKEPHMNSRVLEKMVFNIQEKSELEPLSPTMEAALNAKIHSVPVLDSDSPDLETSRNLQFSNDSSCISTTTNATAGTARQSEHRDSETSVSSGDGDGLIRSGSVVKGFSPVVSSFRAPNGLRLSQLSASKNSGMKSLAPSRAGMFTLGGSSEDDDSSFEQRMSYKRAVHDKRKSSLSQSMSRDLNPQKKTTSFRDIVEQRRIQEGSENDEGAIASDSDSDDDVIDSAISEEDEDDWEEMATDDEKQAKDALVPVFKRIDSRPNLVSRRSILTQGLTEGERAKGLLNAASQSSSTLRRTRTSSHAGPSMPGSPDENEGMMMQGPKGPKPLPIIPTTSNTYAMAQSPRATRRAMLSTELTESLRKNMLLERQGKQANLSFMRRQAASMANLQRANANALQAGQPQGGIAQSQQLPLTAETLKNNNSWTEFDNPWEYHTKGW